MSAEGQSKIVLIPIEKIKIPEERARSNWSDEQQQFLKASLAKFGVLQHPVVRPLENGEYELVDGEHRIKTAKEAGLSTIPCYVVEMSEKDASVANLMLNVARGEQDPIGAAIALRNALKAGMSVEEIAAAVGHTPSWVKFMLTLLDLPEEFQQALKDGRLNVTHIRKAAALPDINEIYQALDTAMRLNWPASTLERYVENRLEELRRHYEQVEQTGVVTPPPQPEPEKLIKFSQCLVCGRMVERERIYLPAQCDECYNLIRYVVTQVGTGEKAMNYIYQALNHYQAFLQYQQQFMAQKQMEQTNYPVFQEGVQNSTSGENIVFGSNILTDTTYPEKGKDNEKEAKR